MRFWGPKQTPLHPVNPDTVVSKLLTAGTAEAFDFPTGSDFFRVSVGSTASGFETVFINIGSTKATVPTTAHGLSSQGSSEFNIPVGLGEGRMWQRARATTGFSLIAVSSLHVCVEFWGRHGATST
jgi:hypothetical protein